MGTGPALSVEGVTFAYHRGVNALQRLDLTIEPGEFVAIIGNNGSGKSTLMKLIVGLLQPTEGRIVVDGQATRGARVSQLAQRVGFIFQDPNDQLFASTVEEEIRFGLRNLGLPEPEQRQRLEETLDQFGLREERDVFPRFLSRGDKQKVCIASVVAMRPRLLLLDEPTTGQDQRDSRAIMEIAQSLNERGMTILLVTHDLINVAEYARRVIVLNNGRLVRDAPTLEVMTDLELLNACHLVAPQVVQLSLHLADAGIQPALSTGELVSQVRERLG